MTNRQIETSRELRLWVSQVIIPGIIIWKGMDIPEVKDLIGSAATRVKNIFHLK